MSERVVGVGRDRKRLREGGWEGEREGVPTKEQTTLFAMDTTLLQPNKSTCPWLFVLLSVKSIYMALELTLPYAFTIHDITYIQELEALKCKTE